MSDAIPGGCKQEQTMGLFCSREFNHSGPCALHSTAHNMEDDVVRTPKPVQHVTEKSGGPVNYYLVNIDFPNQGDTPYRAECGDIIEALGMTFNEACEFKALWRTAAARTLGLVKDGHTPLYDTQKRVFYAKRDLALLTRTKT